MQRDDIPINDLLFRPFNLWNTDWALLASGDFAARNFNSMTISWGSLGVMWGRPLVMVVVRPQRHTFTFMEQFADFTFSVFPAEYHTTLEVLGTKSGRDMDKIGASGLTPIASTQVASPSFDEAELIFECRKMYFDDYDPAHFLAPFIQGMYRDDYHRMYFGEIVAARGAEKYQMPVQA